MVLSPFHKRLIAKLSIAAGLIIVLSAGLISFNIYLNNEVIAIQQQKGELALRTRTLELVTGGNTDAKRAIPLLERLKHIIPPRDELSRYRYKVQDDGKLFNLEVAMGYTTEIPATASEPGSIAFTLAMTGLYDDIIAFMQHLEADPYFIRFDNISLSYQKDSRYNLTTSGVIYNK